MKTNIKMRVTPEQSRRVQEICFKNGIEWRFNLKKISHVSEPYLAIEPTSLFYRSTENDYFSISSLFKEIDADLFIRTNGTCEENNSSIDYETLRLSHLVLNSKYEELEQKLKKKNEILKKARIKRKNQREQLHKLNLKLQKCISLEEHNIATQKLRDTIIRLKCENIKQSTIIKEEQNKEIEKLKAVIEYLESKAKWI